MLCVERVEAAESNSPGPPSKGLPPPAPSNVVGTLSPPPWLAPVVCVARAVEVVELSVVSEEEGAAAVVLVSLEVVAVLVLELPLAAVVASAGAAVLMLVVGEGMLLTEVVVAEGALPSPTSPPHRNSVTVDRNICPMTVSLPARSP